jgi:hypothetical protein
MPQDDQIPKGNDLGTKTGTAKNLAVGVEIEALRQENAELKVKNDSLAKDLELANKQLDEANKDIMSELREGKIKRIMGKSNYTRAELDQQYPPGDPEALKALQKLDESLSRGLGAASASKTGTYKPVSTAKDAVTHGSVPDLFGKNRATVLKELGEA